MSGKFERLADEFEARIKAAKIDGSTYVTLLFRGTDQAGREVGPLRMPIETYLTVQGATPGSLDRFAADFYLGTIVDNMRSMVLRAQQGPAQAIDWPSPIFVSDIDLEITPA